MLQEEGMQCKWVSALRLTANCLLCNIAGSNTLPEGSTVISNPSLSSPIQTPPLHNPENLLFDTLRVLLVYPQPPGIAFSVGKPDVPGLLLSFSETCMASGCFWFCLKTPGIGAEKHRLLYFFSDKPDGCLQTITWPKSISFRK